MTLDLDFSRCRSVWVPPTEDADGFWSPPPPHVKVGVRWIIDHPYALLADDMGGQKTAQSLIAAQFMHDMDLIDRVIVIAPASVRPKVWFDQDLGQIYEQAFDDKLITVSDYHQRIKRWSRGPKDAKELRIICANYEYLRGAHLAALLPYCGLKTLLVLDESSAVRGHASAQTDAVMKLRWKTNARGRPVPGAARCGRVLELNGTPLAESPLDLFSQANILHPSILECRYVTHFKARYAEMAVVRRTNGTPMPNPRTGEPLMSIAGWKDEGVKDLQRRLAPYVLRREAKDLGIDFALSPVSFEVRLTPETWRHYVAMRNEMVVWLKSGVATARTAAVKSIRLSQITSGFLGGVEDAWIGPVDDLSFDVEQATPAPVQEIGREKLDFALAWHAEMLRRYPDLKLLTWCRFVVELRRYLKEERAAFPSIPVGAACGEKVLDGEQSQKAEREAALRLLHPKTAPTGPATVGATQGTGAMGLNFTACRTVLDMSFDFSPWKKRQGDARVNRPGQTGPVSFFYLVAVGPKGQKTIDHHVVMHRLGKMNVNDLTTAAWVRALEEE